MLHQERIFAHIEVRRQGRELLLCQYKNRLGCFGNYHLYVSDYANEVDKEEYFSQRLGQHLTTYGLNFWLKAVGHLECPEEGE